MDDFFTEDLCFDNRKEGEGGAPNQRSPILRMSAWAIRATTAWVGGYSLLAVLVHVADEHPALKAGTRTLEAGVVRLYGVVIVAGLRYSVGVHRGSSLWAGSRGVSAPAGPFLYPMP